MNTLQLKLKKMVPQEVEVIENAIITCLAAKEKHQVSKDSYDAAKEGVIDAIRQSGLELYKSKKFQASLEDKTKLTIKVVGVGDPV